MSSSWSEVVTVLAWTKQNTMQRAMRTVSNYLKASNNYKTYISEMMDTVKCRSCCEHLKANKDEWHMYM